MSIWYKIKPRKVLSQIMRRSSSTFKENHVFIEEEHNPFYKRVMVQEELDGIDVDGTRNLMDLPSLMFI